MSYFHIEPHHIQFTEVVCRYSHRRTTQILLDDVFAIIVEISFESVCPGVFFVGGWGMMQEKEIHQSRWRRYPRDPNSPRTSRRNRKTKTTRDCHVEKKQIRVRDLGLGYDSDEIILFKYCVGTCHSARKNYDLALKGLMDSGSISGKKVSNHPCCRPTRYETVSFMDAQTIWQTIKWLSAANCSCVG